MGQSLKIEPWEFLLTQNIQFRSSFSVTVQNSTCRRQRTGCCQKTKNFQKASSSQGAWTEGTCRIAESGGEQHSVQPQGCFSKAANTMGWGQCCFLMQELRSGSCWLWHLSSALPVPPFPSAQTEPWHSSAGEPLGTKNPWGTPSLDAEVMLPSHIPVRFSQIIKRSEIIPSQLKAHCCSMSHLSLLPLQIHSSSKSERCWQKFWRNLSACKEELSVCTTLRQSCSLADIKKSFGTFFSFQSGIL